MNNKTLIGLACALCLLVSTGVPGAGGADLSERPTRVKFGPRVGFNIDARFRNLVATPNPGPDPSVGTGMVRDRKYNDGYVSFDSSENALQDTWNYGFYDNGSLVNTIQRMDNRTLSLHSISSPAEGYARKVDDWLYGAEIGVEREIVALGPVILGISAGFGYNNLNFGHGESLAGNVATITDTYTMTGPNLAPYAPFYGDYYSSNPTLGTKPTRNPAATQTTPATARMYNQIKGHLYGLKLGPFFELPITKWASVRLDAGLATLVADYKFSWRETVTGVNLAPVSHRTSTYDKLAGFYAGAAVDFAIYRRWNGFLGITYQNVGKSTTTIGGKEVILDTSKSMFVNAGLGFSF